MTIGSAHTYINKGVEKGFSNKSLLEIYNDSLDQKKESQTYIYSLAHLCHYSGANFYYLRHVIQRRTKCYDEYQIPKRSGGHRFIASPKEPLKEVQRWINRYVISNVKPHWRCYSYHSGSSIYSCAKEHCGAKWLIKLDIENFFDSVSEITVYKLFRSMGYKALVAFELARLCTIQPSGINRKMKSKWINYSTNAENYPYPRKGIKYFGRLPQGAPTSPGVSNLIFKVIDEILQAFSEENVLTYTRYADDLCFSSHDGAFSRKDAKTVIDFCTKVLRDNGYASKKAKTKIIPPGVRKIVLGLNVDHELPKLTKVYKKRLEGHIRGLEKFGVVDHAKHKGFDSAYSMLDHVLGLINHARLIDKNYADKLKIKFNMVRMREGIA